MASLRTYIADLAWSELRPGDTSPAQDLQGLLDPSLALREDSHSELQEWLSSPQELSPSDVAQVVNALYRIAAEADHGRAYAALLLCTLAHAERSAPRPEVWEALTDSSRAFTTRSWTTPALRSARRFLEACLGPDHAAAPKEQDLEELWDSLSAEEHEDALTRVTMKAVRAWCAGDPLAFDCVASVIVPDLAAHARSLNDDELATLQTSVQPPGPIDETRLGAAEEQAHLWLFESYIRWRRSREAPTTSQAGREGWRRAAMQWIEACAAPEPDFAAHLLTALDAHRTEPRIRRLQVLVLAAQGRAAQARAAALGLARDWLAPPTPGGVNQELTRTTLLELLGRLHSDHEARQLSRQIKDAPEPELALPEGDRL